MASWWCAIHGYRHPALDAALTGAARAHGARDVRRPHARARGAPGRAPDERSRPTGSSACSSPTRARCRSRWRSRCACSTSAPRGRPARTRLLTVRGGYHGDTAGAMAVCDPVGGMHSMFAGVLAAARVRRAPARRLHAGLQHEWAAHVRELAAASLRGARGGDPRAGRAGRGGNALPLARSAWPCCASSATSTGCCWCSMRSPPASGAAARCSPPSTRA